MGENVLKRWKLDGSNYTTGSPANVTMNSNHTLTAVYEAETQQLYLEVTPTSTQTLDWGESITYTCTVKDQNNNTVSNANVGGTNNLTGSPFSVSTGSNGKANYTTTVPNGKANGTYSISFIADKSGYVSSSLLNRNIQVNHQVTTYTLTINSENPNSDVPMSFTPDINGKSFGNTPTSAVYNSGASVYVYAPNSMGENVLKRWKLDESNYTTGSPANVTMNSNHTLTAVYEAETKQLYLEVFPTSTQILDWGESVTYTCTVTDQNGSPVNSAGVGGTNNLTESPFNVTTDSDGKASYTTTVPNGKANGTYTISFIADKSSYISSSLLNRNVQVNHQVTTYTLTINSENPNSDVPMSFTPDVNEKSFGNTPTSAVYNSGTSVYVYAPNSMENNVLKKWKLDGSDYTTGSPANITMNSNHTLTAIYEEESNQLFLEVTPTSNQILDWGQSVTYTCTVKDQNNNAINGVNVGGTNGLTGSAFNVTTGSDGKADYTTTVPNGKSNGIYTINFIADKSGYISSSLIQRYVQLNHSYNAPKNLTAQVISINQINLKWEDISINETGFKVERRTGTSGNFIEITSLQQNSITYSDNSVSSGSIYYYRVCSYDANGKSDYSNIVSASTSIEKPISPSNLQISNTTTTSIEIEWKDNSYNEDGFVIERKGPSESNYSEIARVGKDVTRYKDENLNLLSVYEYRVKAYNSAGYSNYSNSIGTLTQTGSFNAQILVTRNNAPIIGAAIYLDRGNGFQEEPEGITGDNGRILINNLNIGDKIRAKKILYADPARKDNHEEVDDLIYELWLDSDIMQENGNYISFKIDNQKSEYIIELLHPIFKYNLVVNFRENMSIDFFNKLKSSFENASKYLYDVTDGQALFNKIKIFHKDEALHSADMVIYNQYEYWPKARVYGIYNPSSHFWENLSTIHIGLTWGNSEPDQRDYYRTIIHEFGHYAFGFYDEYLNGLGEDNWRPVTNFITNAYPSNYGFMDRQYTITEMSSVNDYPRYYLDPSNFQQDKVTMQLYYRKSSCWQFLREALIERHNEDCSLILPPTGWFDGGNIYDREGPNDLQELPTIIPPNDLGNSNMNYLALSSIAGANVFIIDKNKINYLGKTDFEGNIVLDSGFKGEIEFRKIK